MACIFCSIIHQEIPSSIVYQDEKVIVLNDLNPQAPLHCLIIPIRHIATLNDLTTDDQSLIGHMVMIAKERAKLAGFAENGYRLNFNCNAEGGQTVFHIHLHLLAGRTMHWPPG